MVLMTEGEEILGHRLVLGTGRCTAEASDHPLGIDRGQQVEALVPPKAIAPTDVSLACQPAPRRLASLWWGPAAKLLSTGLVIASGAG